MQMLQDWTSVLGDGTTPFVQSVFDWADLAAYGDVVLWLQVRAVGNPGAGSVTLSYETAPSREDSLFQSMASVTLAAASAPIITKIRAVDNPATPLARWLRWKLVGTASGGWSVTFRIFVSGGISANAVASYHPIQEGNAILYYDFQSGQVTTATGISQVNDQSTNARHATQATGANQPALGTTAEYFNTQPYAAPDGVNDFLDTAVWTPIAQPGAIFVVALGTSTPSSYLVDCTSADTGANVTTRWEILSSTGGDFSGAAPNQIGGGGSMEPGVPFVGCVVFNGANSAVYMNDMAVPIVTGDIGSLSLASVRLFGFFSGGGPFGGKLAQLCAFSMATDQATRGRVRDYLVDRFITPRALALSGYWRSYTSGDMAAETSLGASGSAGDLTEATTPPTVTTVNGHSAPSFDGVNDQLAVPASTLISSGATECGWGFVILPRSSPDGDLFDAVFVLSDHVGGFANCYFYEASDRQQLHVDMYTTTAITITINNQTSGWSLGEVHLVLVRAHTSNFQIKVDNGDWINSTAAFTALGGNLGTSGLSVGWNGATSDTHMDAILPELFFKDAEFTDLEASLYWQYVVQRFGDAPAKLPLSGWWRANGTTGWQASAPSGGSICFFGSVPSLGLSGPNRGMLQSGAGLFPGTYTLNGNDAPDFDGADDYLNFIAGYGNQQWTSGPSGYIAALIYADTAPTATGTDYADGNIYTDPANAEVTFGVVTVSGTAKLVACLLSGATYVRHPGVACTTGAWHFVEMRYDSTNLSLRVDQGAWSNQACGAWDVNTPSTPIVGRSYLGNVFFDGKIAEMFASKEALTDAQSAVLYAYLKGRYPSAGLP